MEVVTHIVKYNSQTSGRDKLCRFFQYWSKFMEWYVERGNYDKNTLQKISELGKSLSSARKVMRLGKSLDLIQGALKSSSVKDFVIRTCLVFGKLNQSIYLLVDNYIWLVKVGLVKDDSKKLTRVASRLWLITLFFNLMRNVYDFLTIIYNQPKHKHREQSDAVNGPVAQISTTVTAGPSHKAVLADTLKNVCDVFLPMSNLQYVNTSLGFQGIMGMTSSLMGMLPTWDPSFKLQPS